MCSVVSLKTTPPTSSFSVFLHRVSLDPTSSRLNRGSPVPPQSALRAHSTNSHRFPSHPVPACPKLYRSTATTMSLQARGKAVSFAPSPLAEDFKPFRKRIYPSPVRAGKEAPRPANCIPMGPGRLIILAREGEGDAFIISGCARRTVFQVSSNRVEKDSRPLGKLLQDAKRQNPTPEIELEAANSEVLDIILSRMHDASDCLPELAHPKTILALYWTAVKYECTRTVDTIAMKWVRLYGNYAFRPPKGWEYTQHMAYGAAIALVWGGGGDCGATFGRTMRVLSYETSRWSIDHELLKLGDQDKLAVNAAVLRSVKVRHCSVIKEIFEAIAKLTKCRVRDDDQICSVSQAAMKLFKFQTGHEDDSLQKLISRMRDYAIGHPPPCFLLCHLHQLQKALGEDLKETYINNVLGILRSATRVAKSVCMDCTKKAVLGCENPEHEHVYPDPGW
ncbi:hypothetical protein K461DRAFT_300462 [Myriangium duriaei CBS 260.36]|uniref:Uncharacterized protein n=1 Tax=Myriangium duriaei CBS 260.36 TaxID=1168546 RepID=A0A9P4IX20_9PEZI|nr:hypothetical protein K461DRAFT_300462 [Myriangium duriaei CBS 260.36]